jgi:peptide/nickel transport system substrate-binding protein
LTAEDVQAIVAAAISNIPEGLTPEDVQAIVTQAISEIPEGLTAAQMEAAIKNAVDAGVQRAVSEAVAQIPPTATPEPTPDESMMMMSPVVERLLVATDINVESNDPTRSSSFNQPQYVHMYEALVRYDELGQMEPMLAESWDISTDATQWTFNLRQGVTFRHGKEFTAEDVVYSMNRLFEVESPLAGTLPEDMKVVAVDDHTVRFEFSSAYAPLLDTLVKYHAVITPSDIDPERFATETFGTGAFHVVEHVVGEYTRFERNESYWWEGHPPSDELFFIYLPDPTARAEAIKAGVIDVLYDMETATASALRDSSDIIVKQAPSGGYMNLAMDVRKPPFDNVLVRRAIQAATDRQAILDAAQLGLGGIAYDHPVTPTDPFFNEACKPPDYNPALAQELLAQAGYPNGIELTLYTSTAGAAMVEMATVMKEKAAPAGIDLEIVVMSEDGYWSDGWMVKPFTTVWWGGRPPHEAFSIVYPTGAGWNESFYSNPQVDALIDQGATTVDPDGRRQAYHDLQCLLIQEVPRIIPVFRPVIWAVRTNVQGVEPTWDAVLQVHRGYVEN